jgi:hypothetical protein
MYANDDRVCWKVTQARRPESGNIPMNDHVSTFSMAGRDNLVMSVVNLLAASMYRTIQKVCHNKRDRVDYQPWSGGYFQKGYRMSIHHIIFFV